MGSALKNRCFSVDFMLTSATHGESKSQGFRQAGAHDDQLDAEMGSLRSQDPENFCGARHDKRDLGLCYGECCEVTFTMERLVNAYLLSKLLVSHLNRRYFSSGV